MSKIKLLGICTDTVQRNGKIKLLKGKRQHGAIGWYRIVNPLKKLGAHIEIGMGLSAKPEDALRFKSLGDIWFSKLSDNNNIDLIYGAHKEFTGCKFIIDLDDDPDHVDPDHPDYKALLDRREMRLKMIKLADSLVVATPQIKDAVKHLNGKVTVIPNAIDPAIWDFKNEKKNDGKIRIGWMASGSHFADLPIIQPVMDYIIDKYPNVEFHFAGMTFDNHKQKGFFHHVGKVGYMQFPKWYSTLGIDISIAPLKDTQFNRCKSNIKWMEAAMLEIPTVASDVEPYKCIKHGKDGYLATNSDKFIKYLELLINDKELREKMGKEAKKTVMENYTIDKFLPLYEELFEKTMDKKNISVITAITGDKDDLLPQEEYKGTEYIAFTDTNQQDPLWETRKACDKFKEPVMNAKIHKVLSHKYTDKEFIVWMDGNCSLKQDPKELVKLLGDKNYAFFKHPGRDCVYAEADTCVELRKGKIEELAEQVKTYAKKEYPPNAGLCELTCFIRRNNPETNALFEAWWAEICRHSNRDQISFPTVFTKKDWAVIPGSIAKIHDSKDFPGNDYFQYKLHKKF